MRRFHTDSIGGSTEVVLSPEESNHLSNVLRMEAGDRVILTDNSGFEYTAQLTGVGRTVTCRIEEKRPGKGEMCLPVTVYQAVIKGDHFDYAVQKMTETGAAAIVPFMAARCVRRPKNEQRFTERAQRIAAEAAKQCERSRIPDVSPILSFREVVERVRNCYAIFAYEREDRRSLKDLLAEGCPEQAALIIGPEGGFTQDEIEALRGAGAHAVSLGTRILRSETAAPYVLAQLDFACCT